MEPQPEPSRPAELAAFAAALAAGSDAAPGGADVAVVVAHPDDETIGIGGHLRRLRHATIVHTTDGAPRDLSFARRAGFETAEAYAAARRRELEAATAEAGLSRDRLVALGFSDQAAALNLVPIARALRQLFAERRIRFVLTHPFEGGHPDHDATALAVALACRGIDPAPAVIEMASYHLGEADEPVYQRFAGSGPEIAVRLRGKNLALKRRMLACHRSQARLLVSFVSEVERFRAAPAYDFGVPPNGGRVLWERWNLGLKAADWPDLAASALAAWEEEPQPC